MEGKWIGVGLAVLLLNGFALLVSSVTYTAWSIRMRNLGYYFLLRREVNLQKANDAEEIAESVVQSLRPLCLVVVNLGALILAIQTSR